MRTEPASHVVAILPVPIVAVGVVVDAVAVALAPVNFAHVAVAVVVVDAHEGVVVERLGVVQFFLVGPEDVFQAPRGEGVGGIEVGTADGDVFAGEGDAEHQSSVAELADALIAFVADERAVAVDASVAVGLSHILSAFCTQQTTFVGADMVEEYVLKVGGGYLVFQVRGALRGDVQCGGGEQEE